MFSVENELYSYSWGLCQLPREGNNHGPVFLAVTKTRPFRAKSSCVGTSGCRQNFGPFLRTESTPPWEWKHSRLYARCETLEVAYVSTWEDAPGCIRTSTQSCQLPSVENTLTATRSCLRESVSSRRLAANSWYKRTCLQSSDIMILQTLMI